MSPFGQYDRVDMYIADDVDTSRHVFLQGEVDLNIGVMAVKLEAVLFPEDLPVNRSCHLVLTKNGDALDGTHATLNSSSFFMIPLVIAMIALGLLYRTRRRFKGNTGHFKSLHDHPNSPTDGISKSSMSKSEEGDTSFVGPTFSGGALTGGRNSYNTFQNLRHLRRKR
ncbi:hypothetical protein BGX28_007074 [Mortierella sp. GBA30]|nr:hypothetical protein BGX28_007074 [Mortierella sp. GBA30]